VAEVSRLSRIFVLAGTNGAGKSSIGGATFRARGSEYFNPDEATRRIQSQNSSATLDEANAAAWNQGRRLLERAIAEHLDFAFETTLGGSTITDMLEGARTHGIEVRIWYAGLSSPDLHIERVRSRVKRGGHDIPEAAIRRRYDDSRRNLVRLLPRLTELRVYDNSAEGDPNSGAAPTPELVLHLNHGKIVAPGDLSKTPEWAKPIVAAALKLSRA
jgi:predicted ABC-type ATPase